MFQIITLKRYFELIFWVVALILLATLHVAPEKHFSLCIFKWTGINFCPGCGIGRSIACLFHGKLQASFREHPLGIFAVGVICHRIYFLSEIHLTSLLKFIKK